MFEVQTHVILLAALAFIRIGGIIFALPVFGEDTVPLRVRILLSVALTVGTYPLVSGFWDVHQYALTNDVVIFGLLVLRELLIGLAIGFLAKVAFQGIVMAASIVGFQMGFGTSSLFIPSSEEQQNGFTAFHHVLLMLIFLTLNFHHLYIQVILETFKMIPLGLAMPQGSFANILISASATILVSALQLAAPIVVALMFTTVALGLIARTVPQVNVFVISFPVGFYVGLLVYLATLPLMPGWIKLHFEKSNLYILEALKSLVTT